MDTSKLLALVEVFEGIADWRSAQQTRHQLGDLLTVAVCAVVSGADDFEEISQWGEARLDWLRGLVPLKWGVASADTFERVFAALEPQTFEAAFRTWVGRAVPALSAGQVVAIDGKTSRRTTSKLAATPLHMVSAFAAEIGLVLGQTATEAKSNEITAIPALLRTLDINGCIVTIDAMGTHSAIAEQIRAGGADYVLCVKDNQPKLRESIMLAHLGVGGALAVASSHESRTRGHGREELRRVWAYEAAGRLYQPEKWRDVRSFVAVERTRIVAGQRSTEIRHYISSLPPDAETIARAVRSHWEVENRLHWCLDVQFGDDYARARTGHVAHNFAIVRHLALNLLRMAETRRKKTSLKVRRLLAGTDDAFRDRVLGIEREEPDDD